MLLTKDYFIEGQILKKGTKVRIQEMDVDEKNFDEFIDWFQTLNIKTRTPKGFDKVDYSNLKDINIKVQEYLAKKEKTPPHLFKVTSKVDQMVIMGMMKMVRTSWEEIESLLGGETKRPNKLKKKYATYHKIGSMAYSSFLESVENLEEFFSTLNEPHSLALDKLIIHFVDSKELTSIANYSTENDLLRINPKRVGNTREEYGSLRYVVLHELGHRFLNHNPQRWDYDSNSWVTTKYSGVDSFSGEEKFAELFAISHWPRKYSDYSEKIEKFLNKIEY